jgi:hypothetical protein
VETSYCSTIVVSNPQGKPISNVRLRSGKKQTVDCNGLHKKRNILLCESRQTSRWSLIVRKFGELFE